LKSTPKNPHFSIILDNFSLQFLPASGGVAERIPCLNNWVFPIYTLYMEIVSSAIGTSDQPKTKQCPFCAETIQARAVKCRFCGEFLNTDRARATQTGSEPGAGSAKDQKIAANILFRGRPSLWGLVGQAVRAMFFLAVAAFLFVYPVENLPWFGLTGRQALAFAGYREMAAIALAVLVVLGLLISAAKLKMIYYEVTAERIEWGRGILDRRVDNLDMFRVIDLRMRRSLLDCICGIGTVTLITTDKTDPNFTFQGIKRPRRLYDIIKKASLEADKHSGVIHIE
jgi:membrane protein YdbS with pleckstrin-like domain